MVKVFFTLLVIILLFTTNVFSGDIEMQTDRMHALVKAKLLFDKNQFYDAIIILESHFTRAKMKGTNDFSDPVFIEGRNLLSDCYRLNGQYYRAIDNYVDSAEFWRDGYSSYMDAAILSLVPKKERNGRIIDFTSPLGIHKVPNRFDLLHAFIKIMDQHDNNENGSSLSQWSENMNWFKIKNWSKKESYGWVVKLLDYYRGLITEEQLLNGVSTSDLAIAYFYIGLKYDLEKEWKVASEWYLKAKEEHSIAIEVDLAKKRLGIFGLRWYDPNSKLKEVYTASSALVASYGGGLKKYSINNIYDNDINTVWVPKNQQPKGEWVKIDFEKKQELYGFRIVNGYNKSKDLFYHNSRVKTLKVIFSDGSHQVFEIKDIMGTQEYKLEKTAKWIKFEIIEVIEGTKYKDLCISELKVISE